MCRVFSAVVMFGKGHTRQARAQIRRVVSLGNRIQTNQTAAAGTYKAMVGNGNATAHQTKTAKQIRSASTDPGKVW